MKKNALHGVLPLLVFALFAASLLSVLAAGAHSYRTLSQRDDLAFSQRTAAQYIRTKIQFSRDQADIRAESFGNGDALVIAEIYGEETYLTRFYCHNGFLYELFAPQDTALAPEDGEAVLPLSSLDISLENDLLQLRLNWEDASRTVIVALDASKEVLP
ncbi:MAG: DUF4860 domain-containing protein [Clostridia bacterium]|nr:DUF4860 domain-containing protein [Clostridia bacterium]